MNRLSIGAANGHKPGWTTLDADPSHGPDILAELPPLPEEVKQTAWDEIELIHVIEHFYLWDANQLLSELFEVLRPGGVLVLEQPNIEYCARILLGLEKPPNGSPGQFDMWGFYGDPNHCNRLMGHHWGYTPRTLRESLLTAGFEEWQVSQTRAQYHHPVRDFRLEAVKSVTRENLTTSKETVRTG